MSDIPGGNEGSVGSVADTGTVAEADLVRIKVNGVTIEVAETVKVRDVLTKARDAGAIEGSIDVYVIERVEEEEGGRELTHDEELVVRVSEEFLAVPTGPTDVA